MRFDSQVHIRTKEPKGNRAGKRCDNPRQPFPKLSHNALQCGAVACSQCGDERNFNPHGHRQSNYDERGKHQFGKRYTYSRPQPLADECADNTYNEIADESVSWQNRTFLWTTSVANDPTPDLSVGSYRGPSLASFFLISGLSYKTTFNSELRISSLPLYSI
jgi:hypothetical protein